MTYTPGPGGGIQGAKIDINPLFGNIGGYLKDRVADAMGTSDRSKRIKAKTDAKLSKSYKGTYGALPTDYKRTELEAAGRGLPKNYKETESKAFRESSDRTQQPAFIKAITKAPSDPNNTGARGTQMSPGISAATPAEQIPLGRPIPQMTYESFMRDIGTPQGVTVVNRFESENLPGTPGYGESFSLNSNLNVGPIADGDAYARSLQQADTKGIGPIADGAQYAANISTQGTAGIGPVADGSTYASMVDGRLTPRVTINAQAQGAQADQKERDRQLTPGSVDVARGKRYTAPRGMEGDERFTNFGEGYGEDLYENKPMDKSGLAFLQGKDSLEGLRRAEGQRGIIYQGQQHFLRDPSAEGGLRKVSRDFATDLRNDVDFKTALSAEEARSATKAPATPSGSQNPVVVGGNDGAEVIDDENTLKAKGFAANAVQEVKDFAKRANVKGVEGIRGAIQQGLSKLS